MFDRSLQQRSSEGFVFGHRFGSRLLEIIAIDLLDAVAVFFGDTDAV
jgi:hypothetical protein